MEKETADIIIFGGQSNMVGQTEGLPQDNPVIENAYEYRYDKNALIPLKHPTGEELFWGALGGSVDGCGSLLPAFCRAYAENTGRKVVAVGAARGATTIAEWLHGTQRHYWASKKIAAAIQKTEETFTIGKIFYVWLQGESDALIQTSEAEYLQKLIQYKNELKAEHGIDRFGIIKVGYFASVAGIPGDKEEQTGWDEEIMRAQEKAVSADPDFMMLTRLCPAFSKDERRINPHVGGHYNNEALDLIGKAAGTELSRAV